MRRHLDIIVLNTLLLAVACSVVASILFRRSNTLAHHPAWTVTKAGLARELMGVKAYVSDGHSLTDDRLNLGVWYGFQEVLSSRAFNVKRLEVNVGFEPDGYVVVLYDVRPDQFSGVRLSSRADLPSIAFQASPDGRFLSTVGLWGGLVSPDRTHDVAIAFADSARIVVDGRTVATMPRSPGVQRVGFRGGQRAAWVDDLVLHLGGGIRVDESFERQGNRIADITATFVAAALVMGIIALVLVRRLAMPQRQAGLAVTMLSICILCMTGIAWIYQRQTSRTYPKLSSSEIKVDDAKRLEEAEQAVLDEVRERIASASNGESFRILLVGSSQTWGAGASRMDDIWVRRLERMLNSRATGERVVCLNAGVSGLTSPQVLQFQRRVLAAVPRPNAAIVNLASNDIDTTAYRTNLDSIVTTFAAIHVPVILLMEPNSPERRPADSKHGDIRKKHRIIAEIGRRRGVPVIDMQAALAARNQTGFLWWDFVHLTSYGQQVFAEHLAGALPTLVQLPRT
ncbi:hypothetical protein BH09GEM1_BH09GEM1_41460 [soil metagenome]